MIALPFVLMKSLDQDWLARRPSSLVENDWFPAAFQGVLVLEEV